MDNIELAKSKLERAYRIFENFEFISETDMKSMLHCLLNAIELLPSSNPEKYELYGHVRNLTSMDIKKYGAVFKAMNWKDSMLIKKEDVRELISETTKLF